MLRAYPYFSSLLLAAALVLPAASQANPLPQEEHSRDQQEKNSRVYDSEHKDYHNWNNDEDQQWRQYLTDQHRKYHDYSKANKKEQSGYWNWRHENEDHGKDERDHH